MARGISIKRYRSILVVSAIFSLSLSFQQELLGMGDFFGKHFPKYERRGPIFHYTVTLPNPGASELEVELEAFGIRDGKHGIAALSKFFPQGGPAKSIKDIVAHNAFGNRIGIEWVGDSQETALGARLFLWDTTVPFDRFIRLNYKVSLPKTPGYSFTNSYAGQSRGRLYGGNIFLFPLRARARSRFLVEFKLPKGWELYTTLSKVETAYAPDDLADLLRTSFAVGKFVKYSANTDALSLDVLFGADKETPELKKAADAISSNLKAQLEIFGGPPRKKAPWRVLAICGFDSALGNRGIVNSDRDNTLVAAMPGTQNLSEMLCVISAQTFRFWSPYALRPADGAGGGPETAWMSEGAAEYYAWKSRYVAKAIDQKEFQRGVMGLYGGYIQNPLRVQIALPEAYLKCPESESAAGLVYSKGALLSYMLDGRIAAETKGQYSLDDVMRKLYNDYNYFCSNPASYAGGQGYTNETLIQILNDLTGADYRPFFSDYVLGIKEITEADLHLTNQGSPAKN